MNTKISINGIKQCIDSMEWSFFHPQADAYDQQIGTELCYWLEVNGTGRHTIKNNLEPLKKDIVNDFYSQSQDDDINMFAAKYLSEYIAIDRLENAKVDVPKGMVFSLK